MIPEHKNNQQQDNENFRTAGSGNASNPSVNEVEKTSHPNQLLDEKAGTYIREAGNIEDLPDEKDQQDLDEKFTEQ